MSSHIMKIALGAVVLAIVCISLSASAQTGKVLLYVSPSGNDAWSGKIAKSNATRTDGPLASLDGARMAVRRVHSQSPDASVRVRFATGRYEITTPVKFTKEDSGSVGAPVIFEASPGARPIISGGRSISGFKMRSDGLWEARVPTVQSGKWYFEQLWVNGRRAVRARTPNQGVLRMTGLASTETDPTTGAVVDISKKAFYADEKDIKPLLTLSPQELNDVQVTTCQSWETARHKIVSLDPKTSFLKLSNPSNWPLTYGNSGMPRYWLENYKSALDAPGEWFLGRDGILLYKPLKGEKIKTSQVYAPVADRFLEFAGSVSTGSVVKNIEFHGLTFQHSQYLLPQTGINEGQAEATVPATITITNGQNIVFNKCEISHTGIYAFDFREGSRKCKIINSLLADMGAGGVKIGEMGPTDDDSKLVKNITVDNCIIRGCGKVHTAGIGVIIFQSPNNQITHNDISDLYYTAVSVGWCWGYGQSVSLNNKIDFNHMHHIGYGLLSDMAAVYTLGKGTGTTVSNNWVHDVTCHQYGGWGLYNDEGSTDVVLENNLIYRCNGGGYHQHYGKDNHFTNNIVAFNSPGQFMRTRREEHRSFIIDHNIAIFNNSPLAGNWSDNFDIDYNLYYNTTKAEIKFDGKTFTEWKALGRDVHSIIADPMFVNPAKDDYRLKPGSPASKIGFKPFDYTKAGVYGDPKWIAKAKDYTYPKADYPQNSPVARTLKEDFEKTPVNTSPIGSITISSEGKGDTVLVTDETAASGLHSLKMIDKAGLSQEFFPYINYTVTRNDNSIVTVSFDARISMNAYFWHNWRDWSASPYKSGPGFHVSKGKLLYSGKQLMDIPVDTWAHFTVTCGLGKKANGKWNLKVKLKDQPEQEFKDLAVDNKDFKSLNWVGFVSNGAEDATIYLDNITLK